MPRLYRNNLINSISGFKSANLISTVDASGQANLAIFSSVTHFGSYPPLLGFVTRPHVVPRHTYENLKATGFFAVNHVHKSFVLDAHKSSAKFEKDVDEFEVCGFNKQYTKTYPVPYVAEAKIKIGLRFEEEYPIRANGTILVLGRVVEILTSDEFLNEDGFIDLNAAGTVTINGLDGYLAPEKIARYSYARPNEEIKKIQ